jgi:hypothetical protein
LTAGTSLCDAMLALLTTAAVSSSSTFATHVPCASPLAWSPDGNSFTVVDDKKLFVLAYAAGAPVNLSEQSPRATAAGTIIDVAWTPDGLVLAYLAYATGSSGATVLYLVPTASGETVNTTLQGTFVAIRMSPVLP